MSRRPWCLPVALAREAAQDFKATKSPAHGASLFWFPCGSNKLTSLTLSPSRGPVFSPGSALKEPVAGSQKVRLVEST